MKKNILFWRVYAIVIAAVLITAVFTLTLAVGLPDSVFTTIKIRELLPRAQSLSRIVPDALSDEGKISWLRQLSERTDDQPSVLNAYLLVTDSEKHIRFLSGAPSMEISSAELAFASLLARVHEGESTGVRTEWEGYGEMIAVGAPLREADGVISGALLLFTPFAEATAERGTLSYSLFLSLLITAPIIGGLIYLTIYSVVWPLRKMRDVAVAMARGHFNRHANERSIGEVGELGQALNRLSLRLAGTISDLTLERNRLMQILNGLSEGIIAVDAEGRVTHYNAALKALFWAADTELTVREIDRTRASKANANVERRDMIPHPGVWDQLDRVRLTGQTLEGTLARGNRSIGYALTPIYDESGLLAGAVGRFYDRSYLERLDRMRHEYVANVSHEMRTPLTAIRALIEPMRDGLVTDTDARRRYYDIILREITRLSRLIDDLMELSRLQSGSLAFTPQSLAISELISDLYERYERVAAEHNLTFTVATDFSQCPHVYANPDRVEELLVILIDNAMKYTPSGGITVSGEWSAQCVTLSVSDTGVGIDAENLPYIFDRFYKVDKSHSGLGSGLGLSIAKEMIEKMGERLWAVSEPGQGSSFYFTLKTQPPSEDVQRQ